MTEKFNKGSLTDTEVIALNKTPLTPEARQNRREFLNQLRAKYNDKPTKEALDVLDPDSLMAKFVDWINIAHKSRIPLLPDLILGLSRIFYPHQRS